MVSQYFRHSQKAEKQIGGRKKDPKEEQFAWPKKPGVESSGESSSNGEESGDEQNARNSGSVGFDCEDNADDLLVMKRRNVKVQGGLMEEEVSGKLLSPSRAHCGT